MRMPTNSTDFLDVTILEGLNVAHCVANIVQLDELISRTCQQPITVLIPFDFENGVL
jgi:hypothetical protein